MTKIIAVNGFKRSGKGETANAISSIGLDRALHVQQIGFADKLKILGARSLGFTKGYTDAQRITLMDEAKEHWLIDLFKPIPENLLGQSVTSNHYKFHGLTGRQYLQNLGNDAREVFGEDFWVDQVLPPLVNDFKDKFEGVDVLAITDLRYPNEAQRVLNLGGEVWEVLRPGLESDGHASETPLPRDLITRTIRNDKGLMDLRYVVEMEMGV